MSSSETKKHDLQRVFVLFREALKTCQLEYEKNRDPYRWDPQPQNHDDYRTVRYFVLLPISAYWKFVFHRDTNRRCYRYLVKNHFKDSLLSCGPKCPKRLHERAIIKPWLMFLRIHDLAFHSPFKHPPRNISVESIWWFHRPTKEWKEKVEELCEALKSIQGTDYLYLSLMLEEEFGLDFHLERCSILTRYQIELKWTWNGAFEQGGKDALDALVVANPIFKEVGLALRHNTAVVKLLVDDGRINPASRWWSCKLREASKAGQVKLLKHVA